MFKKQLLVIKTGSRKDVLRAQQEIKNFYEKNINKNQVLQRAFKVFWSELGNFDEIKNIKSKIYFIDSLKYPLCSVDLNEIPRIISFLLHHIQHSHGNVRQAIIRASDNLMFRIFIDLGRDIKKKKKLEKETKMLGMMFTYWVEEVEKLLALYDQPKYKKYKYINSLPVGVYKSLHLLITKVLLPTDYMEKVYREFQEESDLERAKLVKENLPKMRKELENVLEGFLEKYHSQHSLADIKLAIYEGDAQKKGRRLSDIINFFDFQNVDEDEMQFVIQVLQDAWNCFPHKVLEGKSPMEIRFGGPESKFKK